MKILFSILIVVMSMASFAEEIFDKEEDGYVGPDPKDQQPVKLGIDGLPEYPDDDNLRQLKIHDTSSIFYVDVSSVSTNTTDNTPRMIVVAISPYGARTVTYEGFDCGYKRYKPYAYAGSEGPLRPFKDQSWKPIVDEGDERYRAILIDTYLCGRFAYAASKEKILSRMKSLKPYTRPDK